MKRKNLWLGLSFMMVAALILTSCAKTSTPTTVTQTTTQTATQTTTNTTTVINSTTQTTPSAIQPQYGGTLTFFSDYGTANPPSWDCVTTPSIATTDTWMSPYGESLLKGDIDKYGPRGNNTFSFQYSSASQFGQIYGPSLATSWEMTSNPLGVIYHLRKGVMWTGNNNIGMAPRELTADDVAFHLNRDLTSSPVRVQLAYIKSITATDRYTVTVVWNSYYAQWEGLIGLDCGVQSRIIPPEVVKAGVNNWQNQTGTGPFVLTDYVSGSYVSYARNANYWGTTTINGKSYQKPFINQVIYPIIADESTRVASLRTGKIDMWAKVPITYQSSLASTAPDLIATKWLTNRVNEIRFDTINSTYFNNKDVRRAMWVATDSQAITNAVYGGGDIVSFPFAIGVPEYTPITQLPAADQLLYTYDATKAKQMLADAGYPNGFTCEIDIDPTSQMHDIADILVSQWAKVNVTLHVNALTAAAFTASSANVSYKDSTIALYSTDSTWGLLTSCRTGTQGCPVNDPTYNAMFDKAQTIQDPTQLTAAKQALGLYFIDNAYGIGLGNPYSLNCYWPWLKNYYGEISAGNYSDVAPMISEMWIDQNLKKSLGY